MKSKLLIAVIASSFSPPAFAETEVVCGRDTSLLEYQMGSLNAKYLEAKINSRIQELERTKGRVEISELKISHASGNDSNGNLRVVETICAVLKY